MKFLIVLIFVFFQGTCIYGLTESEQHNIREVAADIWNRDLANKWNMNDAVGTVVAQAENAILVCTEPFEFVGKPPKWTSGLGWQYVVVYWKVMIYYHAALSLNYYGCINTAAASYRTAMELASIGV